MQPATPMTYLTTVAGSFHGKVVAARLGAEGIPAQLRGGVDGPYPIFGEVHVYVRCDQLDLAREVLLADAVDAVFADLVERDAKGAGRSPAPRRAGGSRGRLSALGSRRVLALLTLAIAVMLVVVGTLASGRVI
jgi:hypothetical protein